MVSISAGDSKDSSKPLNILSLDGGGVRGLSSLLILESLLQQLQSRSNAETMPLPCEVFDLICGTSTGGLIALMLGRLRMDIKGAIQHYLDLSEKIFGRQKSYARLRRLRGLPVYSATILEKCVKEVVASAKNAGGNPEENELLKDPLDGCDQICRTFVVAVSRSFADSPPKLFRTYSTSKGPADTCRIWEAARATTAASTFFDAMSVGVPPQTFVDGALGGANNPSRLALEEIDQIFPGRQIGCFLSLGTGVPDVVTLKGSLADIARACAKLLTSCERVDDAVDKDFGEKTGDGQTNPYFRFSVNRGLGKITLDEWNRVEELTGVTRGYLAFNEQEQKAERCVDSLKRRIEEVDARRATKSELV